MRRLTAVLAAGACLLSLTLAACATEAPAKPGLKDAVALTYAPIALSSDDPKLQQIGRLIYRGGIVIYSPEARFGGWSGLLVSADGARMLSQSDEAHWLRADLVYNASGNLVGIKDGELADMLDANGHTMAKVEGDAEGLAALTPAGPDGAVAVSFEEDPRIWRYDLSQSLDVRPTPIPAPQSIHVLDGSNQGLEGLTMLKPGTLLAVAEEPHKTKGAMDAWLVPYPGGASANADDRLLVARHEPYEISDAATDPSGKHLYLLERHYFGLLGGIVIAVREIDASAVKPGAKLEGEEIAKFGMHENIDNMEGLALRRSAEGKTFLYMISDDNYNHGLQRTLLEMYEIAPPSR